MLTRNCEQQKIDLTNLLMENDHNVRVTRWDYKYNLTLPSSWRGKIQECLGNGITTSLAEYTLCITNGISNSKCLFTCKGFHVMSKILEVVPLPCPVRIQIVKPDSYSSRVWIIYPVKTT